MFTYAKSTIILLVTITITVCCNAEPQRYRTAHIQQRRIFARQEVAPTPYPSAAELKPEAPFEEAVAAGQQQPDQTYGPPDQTYGPPEVQDVVPNVEQLPAADVPEDFAPPNPDAEELDVPVEDPQQDISARLISRRRRPAAVKSQRLTARLRTVNTQKRRLVQQRLIAAAPPASAVPLPFLTAPQQQYVVLNTPFSYTAQYQSW